MRRRRVTEGLLRLDLEALESAAVRHRKKITEADTKTRPLTIATARNKLQDMVTDEMVERIMSPLLCTSTGPGCDRDPLTNPQPYPVKILRRCWVDALLNGWPLSDVYISKGQARRKWPEPQPRQGRSASVRPSDEDWSEDAERAHAAAEAAQV